MFLEIRCLFPATPPIIPISVLDMTKNITALSGLSRLLQPGNGRLSGRLGGVQIGAPFTKKNPADLMKRDWGFPLSPGRGWGVGGPRGSEIGCALRSWEGGIPSFSRRYVRTTKKIFSKEKNRK